MNRVDSPMQAKAKRRQSDAKWRASVATCYDTLKYVVPNVKNMSKRKISKALILQESEKHIKDLEAAVNHLLEVESKKKGKTLLWEEDSHLSCCTLDKLRNDFSEKQQRVFHMAAHGRRCYNLLQDIKEEVFAMEADPSRLVVLEENFLAGSSKIGTLTVAREGAGVQPSRRINLVLSGPATDPKPWSQGSFLKKGSPFLDTTSTLPQAVAEVPSQTSSSASDQPPTSTSMLPYNQVTIHTGSKPPILISSSSTSPTRGTYTIPLTGKGDLRKDVGRFANSKSSGGISPHEGSQTSQHLYLKQNSGDDLPLSSADGAAPLADGQRFKIHIEHVNGDFYIMSDSKSSIVHLIKTASSVEAGNRCATHPKITSPPEAENEQEVPSMKLPLKRPADFEQEESQGHSQQFALTGIKEIPRDSKSMKKDMHASQSNKKGICSVSDVFTVNEKTYEMIQEDTEGLSTDDFSTGPVEALTPYQDSRDLLHSLEVKDEAVGTHTPGNSQDPLLSSLATPKLDNSTPLFMRTDNDMVIKRPPKLGTARKKLNFGQSYNTTPNKHESCGSAGKAHMSGGGFTPVKLPDEFGMVPEGDCTSIGSLISPWKIVDSPSYAHRISSQNYMAPASILDLDDSLMCLETMDTIDLEDQCDSPHSLFTVPDNKDEISSDKRANKRTVSMSSADTSIRIQPKCRRRLDIFYDDPSPSWEESRMDTYASSMDDIHTVPDISIAIKRELSHDIPDMNHPNDFFLLDGNGVQQTFNKPDGGCKVSVEENHVVPDFKVKNETSSASHDFIESKSACLESSSPGSSPFYSNSDCDDFDGFYYYYRLMSQQLKRGSKSVPENISSVASLCRPSESATNLPYPIAPTSSPSIAARVAHMWSCLPLHDKLTMAKLASLEERNTQKSFTHLNPDACPESHLGIIQGYQKQEFKEDTCVGTQSSMSCGSNYQGLVVSKQESSSDLGACGVDESDKDLLSLTHNYQDSLYTKENVCYDRQDASNERLQHGCVVSLMELKDLDEIHDSFQSVKCNLNDLVDKTELQTESESEAQDTFVLGELSPDLQEIDVQPLVDHTYDDSFHLK